jgi:uncharacterized sulfatase
MDERYDLVRSVTDGRFVYLRNYFPHRSQASHVNTQFQTPTTQVWRKLFDQGKLNEAQATFWRVPKAPEELYDLQGDPDEVRNLAALPEHRGVLEKLRAAQQAYAAKIRDTGLLTEAEVHFRSGSQSPRDALATDARYPFARVFAAADVASLMKPEAVPQLKKLLRDADGGVRYWGAAGALMRGEKAVEAMRAELNAALADPSPSVRIAAAEALAKYGNAADLTAALAALKDCANPTKTSAYAAIEAMNAIDEIGPKASPLFEYIKTMPTKDEGAVARGNDYVYRLQGYVLERNGLQAEGTAKKAKQAKQKKKAADVE